MNSLMVLMPRELSVTLVTAGTKTDGRPHKKKIKKKNYCYTKNEVAGGTCLKSKGKTKCRADAASSESKL